MAAGDSLLCSRSELSRVSGGLSLEPFPALYISFLPFRTTPHFQLSALHLLSQFLSVLTIHSCRNMQYFFLSTSNHRDMVKTTAQMVMRMNPPMSINLRPRRSISRFFNKQKYQDISNNKVVPHAAIFEHSGEFVCVKV